MRKSKKETEEFLGPFPAIPEVGRYQHMVFQDLDSGPWHKSEAEHLASKSDCQTGDSRTKIRKQDAMEIDLRAKGNKFAIVELCKQNDVPYQVMTETILEGWSGKPKGMLQILWERGFIDPAIEPMPAEAFYTNDGKKTPLET
jgi:hypothetical protein